MSLTFVVKGLQASSNYTSKATHMAATSTVINKSDYFVLSLSPSCFHLLWALCVRAATAYRPAGSISRHKSNIRTASMTRERERERRKGRQVRNCCTHSMARGGSGGGTSSGGGGTDHHRRNSRNATSVAGDQVAMVRATLFSCH